MNVGGTGGAIRSQTHGRPRFLDLHRISYPPGALASIAHRVSGVLLALATPVAAYAFSRSVAGPEGFAEIAGWARATPIKLILSVLAAALIYHLLAGVRHLMMDAGIGTSLRAGRRSAWAAMAVGVIAFVVAVLGFLR